MAKPLWPFGSYVSVCPHLDGRGIDMCSVYPNIDAAMAAARKEVGSHTRTIYIQREQSGGWTVKTEEMRLVEKWL